MPVRRVGGDKFDEAIINYISRNYGMLIGENTAEKHQEEHRLRLPGAEVGNGSLGINKAEGIPRLHDFLQRILEA